MKSARDLGRQPAAAFLTVTLPIIRPVVIGARAHRRAALSIDDFIITFFTIGTGNTLPTLVWAHDPHRPQRHRSMRSVR